MTQQPKDQTMPDEILVWNGKTRQTTGWAPAGAFRGDKYCIRYRRADTSTDEALKVALDSMPQLYGTPGIGAYARTNEAVANWYMKNFKLLVSLLSQPQTGVDLAMETVVKIVKESMQTWWDDWCADTGCHPSDITQHPKKMLEFRAGGWARNVGEQVHHDLVALLNSGPQGAGVEHV